ncbi:hypothetical protein BGW80DRAFT_1466263 [Lactifluus volemus]|nr:hypothetical protein BGW80DRAFT_1466263 [Lactifluus volemus]
MTSPPVTPTATPRFQFPPPSPSVAPPRPLTGTQLLLEPLSRPQDEIGPSNSHEFSPSRVFTETPVSQPIQTPALDTLAGGAEPSLEPRYFPPGKRLAKKKALSGDDELSIFDILNTFRHHWFLSVDNLRANALSAQKAVDGKISWVEFAPQFHAHLVKCAVALVPRPINKVKKVMFGYILELLNGEGPQAFFDLSKGQQRATQAQKEKRRLSRKRNRASRRDRRKAAEEAVNGRPQQQCPTCGRKFASRKAAKRHRCPISMEESGKSGDAKGKGRTSARARPDKPGPPNPPTVPSNTVTPLATTALQTATTLKTKAPKKKKKQSAYKRPNTPSSAVEVASTGPALLRTLVREFASNQRSEGTSDRRSTRLNTEKKRRTRRGLMDSVM